MAGGGDLAEHTRWMRAALALGRRSMGLAAPNPAVGAIVVKNGIVLGRGVTAPGGRPHAEPQALAEAGVAARGATLYVTLEPCNHHGRTPPCTEAVLEAGIARVVFGLRDPDPRVAGSGLERLHHHGVAVIGPVAEDEARRDHLGHRRRVRKGRPAITVKMAETADGFAGDGPGAGRLLITDADANRAVHRLRALSDVVMVGSGTALSDDPLLTVRLPGVARRPVRLVLDTHLRLPEQSALIRSISAAPLIIATAEETEPERIERLEALGATIMRVGSDRGRLAFGDLFSQLVQRGFTRVLCEGGPTLASALIGEEWADGIILITSDRRLDRNGIPSVTPDARDALADPATFALHKDVRRGADRFRCYERIENPCSPD
ncbi:bifunctional diaminohydroxyphosphoribosylaminopyrimidine deaminase/5-amino-6-(5-phosphoribosylamino)uracil reductase RibD [Lichenifustis flavocetrariae]|uniref:Riboflavin biosynthesis protein RibD n=1 Tax=Lichenifustis flavocetrariae TaxID=2949735 RepID=A0AA41YV40_9HYPH|nr:bifunctional diaminohydroxyphosphoribosylaminopyrimidine deaminase/5-amino-6-(5-phosphoribosylamino)uracil reductase RibD [Lichenifustis flavocetrariae]MCW6509134.1 bifunctional diaminohydroxyphosphoribosylaminopyrimidine deaminase/5-amino-6-(5-phosphoribosylamino)uracil reductase RibD [Lichenifustis flavocetrariae]